MDGGDLIPQTPGVSHEGFQNPPSTPPRLPVGRDAREFESGDTTSSSVNLHLEAIASPILAFPSMDQHSNSNSDGSESQSLMGREGNNNSFESPPAPLPNMTGSSTDSNSRAPAIWQGHGRGYGHPLDDPFARNRRRRANSLDEGLPVPRISLRPRFTRHVTGASRSGGGNGGGRTNTNSRSPPHLVFRQQQHDPSDSSCSCLECLIRAMPSRSNSGSSGNGTSNGNTPPTSNRPSHFRSHTYNGSDSSNTDIFAMALQTEQFSETSAPTVPVIHGSPAFELSSLQQNLPPAAQTFFAPRERESTSSSYNSYNISGTGTGSSTGRERSRDRDKKVGSYDNPSRPIPRHHPNRKLPMPMHGFSAAAAAAQSSASTTVHGHGHGHVRHASGSTHHSPFRTSPSMGTATCTLSLSSVSAFDQTTSQATSPAMSPPWQHEHSLSSQSPGNSSIVFEKLETQEETDQKEGIARSHSRNASADIGNNIDTHNFNDNIEERSQKQASSRSRSLPFDEVHLLIDHDDRKPKPDGTNASSSAQTTKTNEPES